jgi:hypothetical protein
MVDLGSDGMPLKVMAAFGALPALIDAWVLDEGQDYFFVRGSRAVAGVV